MKRVRSLLYFVAFVFILAALSVFKNTVPDLYEEFALAADGVWLALIVLMSAVVIHRTWKRSPNARDGFGPAAFPLPKKWKQWMFDETVIDPKDK
jgi:hypothetical protein